MNGVPRIDVVGGGDEFHDSSLVDIQVAPQLDQLRIILSTPDASGVERLWMMTFSGLLRLELETSGSGIRRISSAPLEVYSVYEELESLERRRWVDRLRQLGEPSLVASSVKHIVLASSTQRGWGGRDTLEGIEIVCRDVKVERAPGDYSGEEYSRPRIEGD